MAVGPTDYEIRLRRLEEIVSWMLRMLRGVGKQARAALENSMAQGQGRAQGGTLIFRAVVTTAIPAPANATAAATNSGRATIQLMNPATGAWITHPLFPTPQVIWGIWPGTTTTATVGKVITVSYDGATMTLLNENCT
jgi:hypothetical protein